MLAYAANRPTIAARRSSPHSMLVIAVVHVVAIAVLISAKMDMPRIESDPPIEVDLIRRAPPPPTPLPMPQPPAGTTRSELPTVVDRALPLPPPDGPTIPNPGPIIEPSRPGPALDPLPPLPRTGLGKSGPSLVTPEAMLRPPYPRQKLILEEEASLTLRLSIDERGRVVQVEPVGRADAMFLAAARRHLIAHWRYKPAMEDGRAVASTITTTLHFRLDG